MKNFKGEKITFIHRWALFFSICQLRLRLRTGISCLEKRFCLWVSTALVTSSTVDKAKSASLANKALLFVEALRPIAPCSGTSVLSAFVERFTTTELCKLFPRLPFGPEKLALTWKIFFVSVSLRSEQFRQIVPNLLSHGNTSPRRSSRLWQVFVFCFPENNFLRNAGLSTSLPHCRQMFSHTATRIKVLVCFPPPFHYQTIDRFREVRKVFW